MLFPDENNMGLLQASFAAARCYLPHEFCGFDI
jgi:hypothetical protein